MSVSLFASPSICIEQLDSHWTDGHEILYLNIFENLVGKRQVSIKSDKNTVYRNTVYKNTVYRDTVYRNTVYRNIYVHV